MERLPGTWSEGDEFNYQQALNCWCWDAFWHVCAMDKLTFDAHNGSVDVLKAVSSETGNIRRHKTWAISSSLCNRLYGEGSWSLSTSSQLTNPSTLSEASLPHLLLSNHASTSLALLPFPSGFLNSESTQGKKNGLTGMSHCTSPSSSAAPIFLWSFQNPQNLKPQNSLRNSSAWLKNTCFLQFSINRVICGILRTVTNHRNYWNDVQWNDKDEISVRCNEGNWEEEEEEGLWRSGDGGRSRLCCAKITDRHAVHAQGARPQSLPIRATSLWINLNYDICCEIWWWREARSSSKPCLAQHTRAMSLHHHHQEVPIYLCM